MKNTLMALFFIMAASTIISCKAGDKLDIKTAEEEIAADIIRDLEENMMDLGLSGVKLKNAPKNQNVTFVGTVTYISGNSKIDQEILANYDSDMLTWWFSDDPDNTFIIYLGEPVYQMANESPGYSSETPAQSGGSSESRQSSNTQSTDTDTLGKVEQRGSTFTTYNSRGNQITNFSSPNRELVGWGRDFFVIRSGTTFYTYDSRCRQISSITIGGAATATVENESFTVIVGSSNFKYNRSCKRI